MNEEPDTDEAPIHRFVLTLWFERRERDGASEVLRGSIVAVSPEGSADPAAPPRRAYFQTLDGLVPALRRLLRRRG